MFKLINDLIFLEDESIYGITKDDSIVKIEINDKDEENVKITEIYKFPNDWKIKEDIENKSYNNFNYNYLESYYIKNNKLLIIFKKMKLYVVGVGMLYHMILPKIKYIY